MECFTGLHLTINCIIAAKGIVMYSNYQFSLKQFYCVIIPSTSS